ncbi:MAG: PIG-L deacetylase family protein [Bacteroidota bacterium]
MALTAATPHPGLVETPRTGCPIFISPHLDDAVLACGRLIATWSGALVVTVFAGSAPAGALPTEWDSASGFRPGDDAVARRREEDGAALALLGATSCWLNLLDRQYGPEPALDVVVAQLQRVLARHRADAVFFPLGLFHSDHQLTRRACLALYPAFAHCPWFAYEDALYRTLPACRDDALAEIRQTGLDLAAVRFAEAADAAMRKRLAVACYQSQLRALATPGRLGESGLAGAEAYWQINPASRSSS